MDEAAEFIDSTPTQNRFITNVTAMELYKGARSRRELEDIQRYLKAYKFKILRISRLTSRKAEELMLQYPYKLGYGLDMPDALIAATCLSHDATLVTLNEKHFSFIEGLKILVPYKRAYLGRIDNEKSIDSNFRR